MAYLILLHSVLLNFCLKLELIWNTFIQTFWCKLIALIFIWNAIILIELCIQVVLTYKSIVEHLQCFCVTTIPILLLELEEVSLCLEVSNENAGISNLYQTYFFIGGYYRSMRNCFILKIGSRNLLLITFYLCFPRLNQINTLLQSSEILLRMSDALE
jgi:hypothetical protein